MSPKIDPLAGQHVGYHAFQDDEGCPYGSFEVFWLSGADESPDGEPFESGWYWQACFPGCLPDGEPSGPFTTSRAAWRHASQNGE